MPAVQSDGEDWYVMEIEKELEKIPDLSLSIL